VCTPRTERAFAAVRNAAARGHGRLRRATWTKAADGDTVSGRSRQS